MADGKKQKFYYLNTKNVDRLLEARNLTSAGVEKEMGWSESALSHYRTWMRLIPDQRIQQLADFFGVYPSFLKREPTQRMINKYRNAHKKKRQKDQDEDQKEETPRQLDFDDSTLLSIWNEVQKQSAQLNQILKGIQNLKDHFDFLTTEIAEKSSKQKENSGKQNGYIISLLRDLKKDFTEKELNDHSRD